MCALGVQGHAYLLLGLIHATGAGTGLLVYQWQTNVCGVLHFKRYTVISVIIGEQAKIDISYMYVSLLLSSGSPTYQPPLFLSSLSLTTE